MPYPAIDVPLSIHAQSMIPIMIDQTNRWDDGWSWNQSNEIIVSVRSVGPDNNANYLPK